jgi:nucleotide-binding universal stress UspA family protein
METKRDGRGVLTHALVPVANADDARATATALAPYAPERTTVLHVVEKGGGVPDKTPVEQSEEVAEAAFEAFREHFPDADSHVAYGSDVVGAISSAAGDVGATAIAFRPRGGSRLVQFLSGDRTLRLVTGTDRPVVCLGHTDLEPS